MSTEKEIIESLTNEKNALIAANESFQNQISAYTALGTPEEIAEAFASTGAAMKVIQESNVKLSELPTIMEELEKYRSIGTIEAIDETIEGSIATISSYRELGTVEEVSESITRALELIETYKGLGNPESLEFALDKLNEMVVSDNCSVLANKYGVPAETVKVMYESVNDFAAIESLLGTPVSGRKVVNESAPNAKATELNESSASGLSKLARSVCGGNLG